MSALVARLLGGFTKEPVLGFGLIGLYVTAYQPGLVDTDAKKAFIAGAVLFLQRAYSTPTAVAAEQAESAKYIGAVEHQAVALAGRQLRTVKAREAA